MASVSHQALLMADTFATGGINNKIIDGTASNQFSGTNTGTVTLTTTLTNDVAVLMYFHESNINAASTISTVTSANLTWTRRSVYSPTVGGNPWNFEIWWAPAASALAAEVITITLSGTTDDAAYVAFGVNGCPTPSSPWDTNASLSTAHANAGAGATTLTVSGVSTNSNAPMVIGYTGTPNGIDIVKPVGTTTLTAEVNNTGGVLFARLVSFYENFTAVQSGTSYTTNPSSGSFTWGVVIDALA